MRIKMSLKKPENTAEVRSTDYGQSHNTIVCSSGKRNLGVDASEQKYNIKVSKKLGHPEKQECHRVKKRKMDLGVTHQCTAILKILMEHPAGWVFNVPVVPVAWDNPDYFSIVTKPMDLGIIKSKLNSNMYSRSEDFAADVRLTFSNAKLYNPPGNNMHKMAKELENVFEDEWTSLGGKWNHDVSKLREESISGEQSKRFTASLQKCPKSSQSNVRSFVIKPKSVEESTFGKYPQMRASFHYFLVAWPMAFTLDRPSRSFEVYDIPEGMADRFIVRGFYSYHSAFSGDSVGCAIQPNECIPELEVGSLIAKLGHRLVRQLDRYMPRLSDDGYPTNEHFWNYEFHSHGKFTGMEEREYFKQVVKIYKSHNFVEMLSDERIRPTSACPYSASKIFSALCKGLDHNKRSGIERKRIGQDAYLFQIRLKYDRSLRLVHNPVNYFGDLEAGDEIFFC